ncbi:MAG TPA: YbjN domain-containing protein [Acidimicrobiales bacterium]|nr:YbjN domain-containing protein [Acidimicrobiales bacterium]
MTTEPATPEELVALGALIDQWAAREAETNPMLLAVDHDPAERRWYVRMKGDEKTTTTVWLTLRQRTLHYETYFMPAPEENVGACYEYLLRANLGLFGMRFAIGIEDAIYLVGQMPLGAIDDDELDRIIGASWAYSERYFRPAMAIGYASVFKPR